MPSRIALSWLTDRLRLRPAAVLTVAFLIAGVSGQSFVLAPSHGAMVAYACVHGVFGGLGLVSTVRACAGENAVVNCRGGSGRFFVQIRALLLVERGPAPPMRPHFNFGKDTMWKESACRGLMSYFREAGAGAQETLHCTQPGLHLP